MEVRLVGQFNSYHPLSGMESQSSPCLHEYRRVRENVQITLDFSVLWSSVQ